ncbi:hypothetical protein ES288_D08G307500v1 [Gossypium darwinii]|uniref:Uncharacterized protein n=1 Tax=Gossypium darwinii TaxID=34276 RepID=A0A5D2BSK1_GOSDA|nr:hypothetical protein ES288_D08G307500v1 [Gossypium darwinii]
MLFHAVAEWPFPANVVRNCLLFGNICKSCVNFWYSKSKTRLNYGQATLGTSLCRTGVSVV